MEWFDGRSHDEVLEAARNRDIEVQDAIWDWTGETLALVLC